LAGGGDHHVKPRITDWKADFPMREEVEHFSGEQRSFVIGDVGGRHRRRGLHFDAHHLRAASLQHNVHLIAVLVTKVMESGSSSCP
jgi:hypothetical protein